MKIVYEKSVFIGKKSA